MKMRVSISMSTHMRIMKGSIMKRHCSMTTIHLHLPGEIMHNIFFRLPLQTLSQCSLVCRVWYGFIKDPLFVKLLRSRINQDDLSLLMLRHTGEGFSKFYLVRDNNLHPTCLQVKKEIKIVGSCNGLMCVSLLPDQNIFYICNPITNEILKLPKSIARGHRKITGISSTGFAFDAPTKTYKIIRTWYLLYLDDEDGLLDLLHTGFEMYIGIEIYTLGSGIWRSTEEEDIPCGLKPYNSDNQSQVFVNGALHWGIHLRNSELKYCIGAIDIGDEKFRAFGEPPRDRGIKRRTVNSLREFLCVIDEFNDHIVIWIMKRYRVASSWTREHDIKKEMFGPLQGVSLKTLSTMNNGKLLLQVGEYQGYYDLEKNEFKQILINGIQSPANELKFVDVHVGSLVSPTSSAGIGEEDKTLSTKTPRPNGLKKKVNKGENAPFFTPLCLMDLIE